MALIIAGEIKSNIAAPGVNVHSGVSGDDYGVSSGILMAALHLNATIPLMWSPECSARQVQITVGRSKIFQKHETAL